MKLIFIAGPYRADASAEIHWNIQRARRQAEAVWKMGAAALCPHMNSAHMDGLVPDDAFLAGGLEMLGGCDAMLLCRGWEASSGTLVERQAALDMGMPVFGVLDDLATWLRDQEDA